MKVSIIGAYGETGQSIIKGLQESPDHFEITALVRPSATEKPEVKTLRSNGVKIVPIDLAGPLEGIVKAIGDAEVLISCIIATGTEESFKLVDAAKSAGVGRFVPSNWGTVTPPTGVAVLRDVKEAVINRIKFQHLPYTIIDVGWWYQGAFPRLPSGRIDYAITLPSEKMVGTGDHPTALTDLCDIGKYVARIIVDPRTLNKYILAYNEMSTQNQIFDILEKLSSEKLERKYTSDEELKTMIAAVRKPWDEGNRDLAVIGPFLVLQYLQTIFLRGDNTPEYAKYLGYLDCKDLYPDIQYTTIHQYVEDLLAGKAQGVYLNKGYDFPQLEK